MTEYVPAVTAEFAQTPYQTVVVTAGFAALDDDATWVPARLLGGTFANVVLGTLPLLSGDVGPAPNPASPSTLYPQVFIERTAGDAAVALELGILPAVPVIELFVVLVVIVKLYPVGLSVRTEAVSLCTVHFPDGLGITFTFVVPPLESVIVHDP